MEQGNASENLQGPGGIDWSTAHHHGDGEASMLVDKTSDGSIVVCNSKDPDKVLTFTPKEWGIFLDGVRDGDFDLPQA